MGMTTAHDTIFRLTANAWSDFQKRIILGKVPTDYRSSLKINRSVLVEAIGHAIVDINRMATWHLPEADCKPDRHKYAGFVARWIAKMKPVYCDKRAHPAHPEIVNRINARFALWIYRAFLKYNLPEDMAKHLLYAFHYRDERGETLALIAYACEEISRSRVGGGTS